MNEKQKADAYLTYLEQIIAGEKDLGAVEDPEIRKLLFLAQTMLTNDLSSNSKIRDILKEKILAQLDQVNPVGLREFSGDEELGEEDLDYVAAGFSQQSGWQECPRCGSRSRNITVDGRCPYCKL
ncbi:hypothetical protein Desdi_2618 [Desulfitobacterium dichloroeliminans LMG P-21439]|uniref:Uncharacterized protein n=1 Tax=Desulfitobacterium dichloroeliminans (strain LMG P-21439 / DCA1) TaxID=871963 RepID=L0F8A7_DESDL|nr:hypothetical protein [Desulfitobacterium dichloroeliminans]AGA70034.1 hypothetical protein Desdi_2618 [Desulfitobacterium dichloroeliminans LMG P-21439]